MAQSRNQLVERRVYVRSTYCFHSGFNPPGIAQALTDFLFRKRNELVNSQYIPLPHSNKAYRVKQVMQRILANRHLLLRLQGTRLRPSMTMFLSRSSAVHSLRSSEVCLHIVYCPPFPKRRRWGMAFVTTASRCGMSFERRQACQLILCHYSRVERMMAGFSDELRSNRTRVRCASKACITGMLNASVDYGGLTVMSVVCRWLPLQRSTIQRCCEFWGSRRGCM